MSRSSTTFHNEADSYTAQTARRAWIQKALQGYYTTRERTRQTFASWEDARESARIIKTDAIDHLDTYLEQFVANTQKRGTQIHWASTGQDAKQAILNICKKEGAKLIVKSKSMTAEEIHLNDAIEAEGIQVVESDLGEYIVQLRQEPPFHIVFPAMHLKRDEISSIFEQKLGTPPTDSPEELTMIARRSLRQQYLQADVGITGVNFAIAETGMISITENEGNARLTSAMPRIHIAIMGIEKILPKLEHLALFLPLLATAGTGQHLTCYNTLIGGPRQPGEIDGPEQFHIIILDNQRTHLLADGEQRDSLHCIRCGACLNVCPIFKNIGGHSYGTTYQGPIGSVITPHLRGLQEYKHLSSASSLCGACTETCPVKIDLHHHLLRNRRNAIQNHKVWWEQILFLLFAFASTRPLLFNIGRFFATHTQRIFTPLLHLPIHPFTAWTNSRTLPTPPSQSFRDYWKQRNNT